MSKDGMLEPAGGAGRGQNAGGSGYRREWHIVILGVFDLHADTSLLITAIWRMLTKQPSSTIASTPRKIREEELERLEALIFEHPGWRRIQQLFSS